MSGAEIDTTNKFLVSSYGDGLAVLNLPRGRISNEDALLLAAWLVALSTESREDFIRVLDAVEST